MTALRSYCMGKHKLMMKYNEARKCPPPQQVGARIPKQAASISPASLKRQAGKEIYSDLGGINNRKGENYYIKVMKKI